MFLNRRWKIYKNKKLLISLTETVEFNIFLLLKFKAKNVLGLENLAKLEEFWANSNKISNWTEVDKLKSNTGLLTVYLEHNQIHQVRYLIKGSFTNLHLGSKESSLAQEYSLFSSVLNFFDLVAWIRIPAFIV